MLSAERNGEINVIDESQAEKRPVLVQGIKLAAKKFLWSATLISKKKKKKTPDRASIV